MHIPGGILVDDENERRLLVHIRNDEGFFFWW